MGSLVFLPITPVQFLNTLLQGIAPQNHASVDMREHVQKSNTTRKNGMKHHENVKGLCRFQEDQYTV